MTKMKNLKSMKYWAVALLMAVVALFPTSCSDDEVVIPEGAVPGWDGHHVTEGVVFNFKRKIVYTASGVNEIGSVKILLSDGQNDIQLPSLLLSGDAESVKSKGYSLPAGTYKIKSYTAYTPRHEYLFDAEFDDADEVDPARPKNRFTVEEGQVTEFVVPIKTREIMTMDFLRNSLLGICREVFGPDESQWPWDPKKYPYPDWEGLEFEMDDYGRPMFLSSIYFEGIKDGKETPWVKMTAIPEGTISNIASVLSITVTDIPGFKKLPDDINRINSLNIVSCVNTGVEELPATLWRCPELTGVFVVNGQMKEFPADIASARKLRYLNLEGNQLENFSTSFADMPDFESLSLSHNPLTTLGEEVFCTTNRLNELRLADTRLASLPQSIAEQSSLRSIDLSGAKFTAVPEQIKSLSHLLTLWIDANGLTKVSAADFAGMTHLRQLSMDGNAIGELPVLSNANLQWLSVENCALNTVPDFSSYAGLRVARLGGNLFTTLPEECFAHNPKMRVLSLSGSDKLASMPRNTGLKSKISDKEEGLKIVEVENCPNLVWTMPAEWKCYDFTGKTADDYEDLMNPDGLPDVDVDPMAKFGCVGVLKNGSPKVVYGK